MPRLTVVLKQPGDAIRGFGNTHGPPCTFSGWGVLTVPPAADMGLIPNESNTLIFHIVSGLMIARVGDGLSKATDMVVGRGWVVHARPKNWFGFKNLSTTHFGVVVYIHWRAR
jgi:uncharacterized Zn-binding protein involved in type VI secretion